MGVISITTAEEKLVVTFTLNGEKQQVAVDPYTSAATIIREHIGLTGTKVGCNIGRCGACSILVNGDVVNSCLLMAYQLEGKSVTTIEGLKQFSLDDIQAAFLKEGGFQCGYCTSGMIIAVKALLDQYPTPTEAQIEEGLAGNICRCTGYGGIIRAIQYLIERQVSE